MDKGESTRLGILERALEFAGVQGLTGLTIGALAKSVGMSKSGLFAHFQSKEKLQLEVLEWASERFIEKVIAPALKTPRGEPRLRELLKNWLSWHNQQTLPGGCVFISAASEFDDKPGAVKDMLQEKQQDLINSIARMTKGAIEEGHFRADADPHQFAYQAFSLILGYHFFNRLMDDPKALGKLEEGFERLITSYKVKH